MSVIQMIIFLSLLLGSRISSMIPAVHYSIIPRGWCISTWVDYTLPCVMYYIGACLPMYCTYMFDVYMLVELVSAQHTS